MEEIFQLARPPPRPIPQSSGNRYVDIPKVTERPYFDDVFPRNVTAIVGQSSILNCRIKHLGDRTVRLLLYEYLEIYIVLKYY